VNDEARLAPLLRPARRRQGTQRWHRLLFSHWEVPASALRPLVDARLELDAFEGRCFVGLVPFTMQKVRPYQWAPPFPTARTFHEINLRTYVHHQGSEPGVFFFSLEAASSLAVLAARALWRLPYFRASTRLEDDGARVAWESRRRWPAPSAQPWSARFEIGAALPQPKPGSLEFFLAERYQFYAADGRGRLRRARVHHVPYPLHAAKVEHVGAELLEAAGLPSTGARTPDYFSPGVDVDIFSLEPIAGPALP
jgi:uncharacterized protein YqjF (DUF2071 family)